MTPEESRRLRESAAAPVPWRVEEARLETLVVAADGTQVCVCAGHPYRGGDASNASRIARAVNCHDELLAACVLSLDRHGRQGDGTMWPETVEAIRKAIRNATGEA